VNNTLAVLTSGEASPGEVVQATGTFGLIAALIAIPALGAVILLLVGRRANKWGHLLGTAMVLAAFAVASAPALWLGPLVLQRWVLPTGLGASLATAAWPVRAAGALLALGSAWALGHGLWVRVLDWCMSL